MRILFFGTPEFGADVLDEILHSSHEVAGVVCQTDKKGNRNKIEICEVKRRALDKCIPVYQFKNINESVVRLKEMRADIFVTAAYGQILSQQVLDVPEFGVVNVHPSLLPKYRGASPVQSALLNGEKLTGVTIAKTEKKLDSGDILAQQEIEIAADDNSQTLLKKTAKFGGRMLVSVLDTFSECRLNAIKQNESIASYADKITAETCKINWNMPAVSISNQIRALAPEPAAFCLLNGNILKILEAESVAGEFAGLNGQIVKCDKTGIYVKCKNGALSLISLQSGGGKILNYKDFFNGRKIAAGDILK